MHGHVLTGAETGGVAEISRSEVGYKMAQLAENNTTHEHNVGTFDAPSVFENGFLNLRSSHNNVRD